MSIETYNVKLKHRVRITKVNQGFFLQFWEGALGPFRLGKLAR